MDEDAADRSAGSLTNSFVGNTAQVCVVTGDFMKTIRGFVDLEIGPWALYTFGPDTVSDQTYMGRPANIPYGVLTRLEQFSWI